MAALEYPVDGYPKTQGVEFITQGSLERLPGRTDGFHHGNHMLRIGQVTFPGKADAGVHNDQAYGACTNGEFS